MFEKDLKKPIVLEQHEAILRRINQNCPIRTKIEANKEKYRIGYLGEKTINYFLSLLPSDHFHIFHNIRLPAEKGHFQIDTYVVSAMYSLIIEGKNHSGALSLERTQLIQEINGEKKIFENPLAQVYRHKILLNYWFEKNQLPKTPIEHLVCFSNTHANINIPSGYKEAEKRICKAVDLIRKINEFENYYKRETIDQGDIGIIKKLILEQDTPYRMDLLKEYELNKKDISTGVQCTIDDCGGIMNYHRGFWDCPICQYRSRDAHLQAINDHFLIFGPTITNAEVREFLHLPSSRAATNTISYLRLPNSGKTRDRVYFQL